MTRNRPEIHERILSGTHLLVVPSRFKPMPGWQRILVYAVFYGFALFFVMILIKLQSKMPVWLCVGTLLSVLVMLLLGQYLAACGNERKNPLIVTDIGLTISPLHCATWEEIATWHFLSINGLMRQTLSRAGEGTTLCIYPKKTFKIAFGCERNSIFAYQGYFLSEDQQSIWREICSKLNVVESDDFPIF